MSKAAQCYYEILGISEMATTDEIKQAYKKLALVWHPDKNQTNKEEAHARFQTILKAYETLSDSREREWYDRHKDQILSGGDKDDAGLCKNLFQYFSSACYANFDDSEDGFYTVYRGVFDRIKQEEEEAIKLAYKYDKNRAKSGRAGQPIEQGMFPTFGDSQSSYEEVVRPFYSFWSGFCTSLTFDHLDKWNTTEAENRRILRAMEKENKKVKDAAKKERNTNVRNLVEFVKKRDKRLKAHKLLVEQQNELNRKKTAEKQRQQREKSLKESSTYKPTSYFEMDDVEEQLQQLEDEYDDLTKYSKKGRRRQLLEDDCDVDDVETEPGHDEHDSDGGARARVGVDDGNNCDEGQADVAASNAASDVGDDDYQEERFSCLVCHKDFRTINAFENHEASKKHKQKVQKLKSLLEADGSKLNK
jgi:DnaJ family protein A protein 5